MSRIGKKLIELPDKVKLNISGEGQVNVEGPKGKLAWILPAQIKASTGRTFLWSVAPRHGRSGRCTVFRAR